jgi:Cytochrome P450
MQIGIRNVIANSSVLDRVCVAGLRRRLANAQFEKLLEKSTTLNKSVFLGTSQTLPAFLSNAWLALLRHPTEYVRLRAEPYLMPRGIEELLRYANIVHTLLRQATADLELGGVSIRRGEHIILKLDAANRDLAHVSEPDRLDLNRRLTRSYLALARIRVSADPLCALRLAPQPERLFRTLSRRNSAAQLSGTLTRWSVFRCRSMCYSDARS